MNTSRKVSSWRLHSRPCDCHVMLSGDELLCVAEEVAVYVKMCVDELLCIAEEVAVYVKMCVDELLCIAEEAAVYVKMCVDIGRAAQLTNYYIACHKVSTPLFSPYSPITPLPLLLPLPIPHPIFNRVCGYLMVMFIQSIFNF